MKCFQILGWKESHKFILPGQKSLDYNFPIAMKWKICDDLPIISKFYAFTNIFDVRVTIKITQIPLVFADYH